MDFVLPLYYINGIAYSVSCIGLVIIYVLMYITPATYGRYSDMSFTKNIMLVPGWIAWIIMECPNLVVPTLLVYSLTDSSGNFPPLPSVNCFLIALFMTHYIYRCLIFPCLASLKPMGVESLVSGIFFCIVNSYIQICSLLVYKYDLNWIGQVNFLVGVSIWLFGFLTNVYSDHLLRNLRKPGETGYKIPKGYLFEYISCANFFGEVMEWFGFALACWNPSAVSFALFTASNLIPRGLAHHKYYLQKMDDYPKNRKAVIPFLL